MSTTSNQPAFPAHRGEPGARAVLKPEVERDLAARCKAGDRDAGNKLMEACLPFVMMIAREYRRWGLPLEDLVQEGNIGLLKAIERFDPDRGARLVTYAAYWIRSEIREYVARGYRIVRLGSSKRERRALRIYRRTHESNPAALAELSGMTEAGVIELLPLLMARETSLESSPAGEGKTQVDRLADGGHSPEEAACLADERERVEAALRTVVAELGPRDRGIVRERWLTEDPKTLEELGVTFGVSKERVRQLEDRAKKRMRKRIEEIVGEPVALTA